MADFRQLYRPNLAPWRYTWALASAYQRWPQIYDSEDFASINDDGAWEKIRRDAVWAAAIENRRKSVAGLDWQHRPATDTPGNKRVSGWMDELCGYIEHFYQARYNLTEAIFRGSSYAAITGEWRNVQLLGDTKPRRLWLPTKLAHIDRWRWRLSRDWQQGEAGGEELVTRWELFSVARQEWEVVRYPHHFVRHYYERIESDLGYGRGILNSLYFWLKAKEVVLAQGLAGVERWAQGLLMAKVDDSRIGAPGTDNEEIRDQYNQELAKMRSEHVISYSNRDEVTAIWPSGTGHAMVTDFLEYLDAGALRLIQASDLTTGESQSGAGSYAQASVQGDEKEMYYQSDRAALSEDLENSVSKLMWTMNAGMFKRMITEAKSLDRAKASRKPQQLALASMARTGNEGALAVLQELQIEQGDAPEQEAEDPMDGARAPTFEITQRGSANPADEVGVIAQALAAGIPLMREEVYERLGFRVPGEDDDIIEPMAQPDAGGGAFDFGLGAPTPVGEGGEDVEVPVPTTSGDGDMTPDLDPEDQAASELLGKVGGISGWLQIAEKVSAGELDRESAVAAVMTFFRLEQEEAERLVPEEGEKEPEPPPGAGPPSPFTPLSAWRRRSDPKPASLGACKPGQNPERDGCTKAEEGGESDVGHSLPPEVAAEVRERVDEKLASQKAKRDAKKGGPAKGSPGSQLPPGVLDKLHDVGCTKIPPVRATNVELNEAAISAGGEAMHSGALVTFTMTSKAGRVTKRYGYSELHDQMNAERKWQHVRELEEAGGLDALRPAFSEAISSSEPGSKPHADATAASIISLTGLRPGGKDSVPHGHYGVTTLRAEDVDVEDGAGFDFIGKEGMRNTATISDAVTIEAISHYKSDAEAEGREELFPAQPSPGKLTDAVIPGARPKDLRTLVANESARMAVDSHDEPPPPGTSTEIRDAITRVLDATSEQLNNKPAQAKKSYVFPEVLDEFKEYLSGG